jgi:hypothetical protein
MTQFLSGVIAMGYAVAALFFVRFWKTTRDRLFGLFAASFGILAAQRVALLALDIPAEHKPLVYLSRLAAYLLILFAILDKNRER